MSTPGALTNSTETSFKWDKLSPYEFETLQEYIQCKFDIHSRLTGIDSLVYLVPIIIEWNRSKKDLANCGILASIICVPLSGQMQFDETSPFERESVWKSNSYTLEWQIVE